MNKNDKQFILDKFNHLTLLNTRGITNWLREDTDDVVFEKLAQIEKSPLSKVQLNQLLALGHEGILSEDFFEYYWLSIPVKHIYDVTKVDFYDDKWNLIPGTIQSLDHFLWGLTRLYIDGLLILGNVRFAYRSWRALTKVELELIFENARFDIEDSIKRGPPLDLINIPQDKRYLISEMACKSLGDGLKDSSNSDLKKALHEAYISAEEPKPTSIKELVGLASAIPLYKIRQIEFEFSVDEISTSKIGSTIDLESVFNGLWEDFAKHRTGALENTKRYLSMVNELDVYVATSMRSRENFRAVAARCQTIFDDEKLFALNLRYFDPTVSAANGHEDKGLIECLMVRCAKVLIYIAGEKDSYGKDAEAAMALSQGKPVIILCDQEDRRHFFQDIHPLSRLIDFKTGVAVGAMVTHEVNIVVELLRRIFSNQMEYDIEKTSQDGLRLKEKLTGSVVRLQTGDQLLSETFWNNYHNRAN